jgi:3'-5' exoribonuclease
MKRQFLRDLKPGSQVDDLFFCARRDVKEKRDGGVFLTFEFRDRTGSVGAIMWDRVDDALRCVEPGGFYRVQGKLGDYQGKPQLTVNLIYPADPAEIARDDFVGASRHDRGQMLARLKEFAASIKDPHLARVLATFFDDPDFCDRFAAAPGGAAVHHAYLGGLLEHTLDICRIAAGIAETYPETNRDLLLTGAILHDVGKIREYSYESALNHTWDGRLLGHIVMGYEMVREQIGRIDGFPEELERLLLHIILAHHGQLEFGSPKTPKFVEAFIVYMLDNLDSRVMMFREAVERNRGVKWTDYHQYLETNVYIPGPED